MKKTEQRGKMMLLSVESESLKEPAQNSFPTFMFIGPPLVSMEIGNVAFITNNGS